MWVSASVLTTIIHLNCHCCLCKFHIYLPSACRNSSIMQIYKAEIMGKQTLTLYCVDLTYHARFSRPNAICYDAFWQQAYCLDVQSDIRWRNSRYSSGSSSSISNSWWVAAARWSLVASVLPVVMIWCRRQFQDRDAWSLNSNYLTITVI